MRIAVIGGGVIGLMTAYELVQGGADVVVVDAGATGLGASAVKGEKPPTTAMLEWEGGKALVSIRYIEDGDQEGTARYGVLFEEISPRFARLIDEHVVRHRPSSF